MKQSPLDPTQAQMDLFEQDIKIPTGKTLLRIDEAAGFLKCSNNHIRNLADIGELEAVNIGSAIDPDEQQRAHKRITSRSVELFINKRRRVV